jgi:hypothetical protein
MAFKPNYGRDRAERQRAARARTEDKQKMRCEKAALRKAKREDTRSLALDGNDPLSRVDRPTFHRAY